MFSMATKQISSPRSMGIPVRECGISSVAFMADRSVVLDRDLLRCLLI
jgi:hypothetical protein